MGRDWSKLRSDEIDGPGRTQDRVSGVGGRTEKSLHSTAMLDCRQRDKSSCVAWEANSFLIGCIFGCFEGLEKILGNG